MRISNKVIDSLRDFNAELFALDSGITSFTLSEEGFVLETKNGAYDFINLDDAIDFVEDVLNGDEPEEY